LISKTVALLLTRMLRRFLMLVVPGAFAGLLPLTPALGDSPDFQGKTAEQWVASWAADIAKFHAVAEEWGLAGIPHFARVLRESASTNERRAALDAISVVLREPVVEEQRRMAEDVAVPAMLPLLRDRQYAIRGACMDALRHIGPSARAAIPAVIANARDTSEETARIDTRGIALSTLSVIGRSVPDEVLPVLVETLQHAEPRMREKAVNALGALAWRAASALPQIEAAASADDETFRKAAQIAVANIRRPRPAQVGDPVPPFEAKRLMKDEAWRSESAKGRVLILEFWSVTCAPCQPAMTKLDATAKKRVDWRGNVEIYAINEDDDRDRAAGHVQSKGWQHLEHVHDPGGHIRALWAASLPETILIDATGRVVWRGHPSEVDLEKEIEKLLGD
jgi:thiol-disulfide isomerase/thioredoxin